MSKTLQTKDIPTVRCLGCRRTEVGVLGNPTDIAPSEHCNECPPWMCECGEMCSFDSLCGCWVDLRKLPLADIKGLLATAGLSVGGVGNA